MERPSSDDTSVPASSDTRHTNLQPMDVKTIRANVAELRAISSAANFRAGDLDEHLARMAHLDQLKTVLDKQRGHEDRQLIENVGAEMTRLQGFLQGRFFGVNIDSHEQLSKLNISRQIAYQQCLTVDLGSSEFKTNSIKLRTLEKILLNMEAKLQSRDQESVDAVMTTLLRQATERSVTTVTAKVNKAQRLRAQGGQSSGLLVSGGSGTTAGNKSSTLPSQEAAEDLEEIRAVCHRIEAKWRQNGGQHDFASFRADLGTLRKGRARLQDIMARTKTELGCIPEALLLARSDFGQCALRVNTVWQATSPNVDSVLTNLQHSFDEERQRWSPSDMQSDDKRNEHVEAVKQISSQTSDWLVTDARVRGNDALITPNESRHYANLLLSRTNEHISRMASRPSDSKAETSVDNPQVPARNEPGHDVGLSTANCTAHPYDNDSDLLSFSSPAAGKRSMENLVQILGHHPTLAKDFFLTDVQNSGLD